MIREWDRALEMTQLSGKERVARNQRRKPNAEVNTKPGNTGREKEREYWTKNDPNQPEISKEKPNLPEHKRASSREKPLNFTMPGNPPAKTWRATASQKVERTNEERPPREARTPPQGSLTNLRHGKESRLKGECGPRTQKMRHKNGRMKITRSVKD